MGVDIRISMEDILAARTRVADSVVRTPLVPLHEDDAPARISLKLENLQPTGSFKVRGAGNSILRLPPERRAKGVYTCSAGNMAQALAYHARRLGVPCATIVPTTAPETKLAGIRRFGARIVQLSSDEVWKIAETRHYAPLADSVFLHPFSSSDMIAGNGTIGLEILEDLPDVDAVVVPFGGGGLSVGIAAAMKARKRDVRVYASEADPAAPLAASYSEGRPVDLPDWKASFVDGIGGRNVQAEMWELARTYLDGSIPVSLPATVDAIRRLAERNRVIAEGAAGTAVAAALSGRAGRGRVVAVVSGGNIDAGKLAQILRGDVPS